MQKMDIAMILRGFDQTKITILREVYDMSLNM